MQLVIKESILDPFNSSDKVDLPAKTIELDKTHIKQGADGGWYVEENLAKLLDANADKLPGTYGTKYEATATITHPDNSSSTEGSSFTLDTLALQPIVEKMNVTGNNLTDFSLDGEVGASYNIKINSKKNPTTDPYDQNIKDGEGNSLDGNVDIKLSNKFSVTKQGENNTTLHVVDQNGNETDYRVSYINYLNKNLTPTEGIKYDTLNNPTIKITNGPDDQLLKTDQGNINDLILINQLSPNAMNGAITLDTGRGNDVVYLNGSMAGDSAINLGDGDNSLVINGETTRSTKYRNITAKSGNDIVRVGTNLDSVDLDLGDGINLINVGFNGTNNGYIYGSKVTLGNDNDTILVRTNIDKSTIDTGSGNDIIKIGTQGDISGRGFFINSTINTEEGNDVVSGNYINLRTGFPTTIDLGTGNDQLILNHVKDYSATAGSCNIKMGFGDDTLLLRDTDITTGVFNRKTSIDFDNANQSATNNGYDTFIYGNHGQKLGESNNQIDIHDNVKFDLSKVSGLDHIIDISERNFDVTLKQSDFDVRNNGFTATNAATGVKERIFFIDGGDKTKVDLTDLHLQADQDKKVENYNTPDRHFGTDGATYHAYSSNSGVTVFIEDSILSNNITLL